MKSILLTGASGFLGSSIKENSTAKYQLLTLGRKDADIIVHLEKEIPVIPYIDIIIHAAGKAHMVPNSENEANMFYDVNVSGTENLLKALERAEKRPEAFVFISSVAVYGREEGELINEDHPLNAKDPYGLSKIKAEYLIQKWCQKNDVTCTILRLPLLVGKNPPGNLGAMIAGIKKGYYFNIAGGAASKSMVLTEDIANIILKASEIGGIFNLTDGTHPSFKNISKHIAMQIGKKEPLNLPLWLAVIMAKLGDLLGSKFPINSNKLRKITSDLTFDDSKARLIIGWKPKPVLSNLIIE